VDHAGTALLDLISQAAVHDVVAVWRVPDGPRGPCNHARPGG
jgi:hypothetical protein